MCCINPIHLTKTESKILRVNTIAILHVLIPVTILHPCAFKSDFLFILQKELSACALFTLLMGHNLTGLPQYIEISSYTFQVE